MVPTETHCEALHVSYDCDEKHLLTYFYPCFYYSRSETVYL